VIKLGDEFGEHLLDVARDPASIQLRPGYERE